MEVRKLIERMDRLRVSLQEGAGSQSSLDELVAEMYQRYIPLKRWHIRWVYIDRQRGSQEAQNHGDKVEVFPKLFDLPPGMPQIHTLVHEVGHTVRSVSIALLALGELAQQVGVDVWDTASLPYGTQNADEAFAECFAVYFTDHGHLKAHYPKWLSIVAHVVDGKPLPKEGK